MNRVCRIVLRSAFAACALGLAGASQAAPRWIGAWGAPPAPPQTAAAGVEAVRNSPVIDDQTVVQTFRLSHGGARLRVRISNEYGSSPLKIGAARLVLLDGDGKPAPGSARELRFSSRTGVTIPRGAPIYSDPVDLRTSDLQKLRIALHLPEVVSECSCHMVGAENALISPKGDFTARPFEPVASPYTAFRAFITGVDVETSAQARVIVTFGDSITDGYLSTTGANRRYPDRLAERLSAANPRGAVAVVNAGISGNRLLADGRVVTMGESALARFDRDVLAVPGATHLIVLEGVNDLGVGGARPPPAEDLILAYEQLIARAHSQGIKVIGATILPYEGAAYFHKAGEAVRQEINHWIRTSGRFDGVVDFDVSVRDPSSPSRMRSDLHAGDWLHPNDAGYRAMGDAVDLQLLK